MYVDFFFLRSELPPLVNLLNIGMSSPELSDSDKEKLDELVDALKELALEHGGRDT